MGTLLTAELLYPYPRLRQGRRINAAKGFGGLGTVEGEVEVDLRHDRP